MKKKIAIIGSTGSIGKQTLEIIKKNKKNFEVILLSTNKNIPEISKQLKIFKPKNLIITDLEKYKKFKKRKRNIKIFNNFNCFKKIFKKKIDYVMSSISGFSGLQPTIDIIKHTKLIAIANKESIICGWNLINKEIKKNKTNFIPVDSEHFSIWSLIEKKKLNIEEIFITASGGPFLNRTRESLHKIKPRQAIDHPNWNMGKKISVDSATMVNKVFEALEAKKIFGISLKNITILSHPDSYVHAIVKFRNGLTKILIHDTSMKIPIFNTIYPNNNLVLQSEKLNFKKLNNLNFNTFNKIKFPSLKILREFENIEHSLYETVLVSANDELVELFLNRKIKFLDISKKLIMIMKMKEFKIFKSKKPNNLGQIISLNRYVRLKTKTLCVRSNDNA